MKHLSVFSLLTFLVAVRAIPEEAGWPCREGVGLTFARHATLVVSPQSSDRDFWYRWLSFTVESWLLLGDMSYHPENSTPIRVVSTSRLNDSTDERNWSLD